MKHSEALDLRPDMLVFWCDPEYSCSRLLKIKHIALRSGAMVIEDEDGSVVECYPVELRVPTPAELRKYLAKLEASQNGLEVLEGPWQCRAVNPLSDLKDVINANGVCVAELVAPEVRSAIVGLPDLMAAAVAAHEAIAEACFVLHNGAQIALDSETQRDLIAARNQLAAALVYAGYATDFSVKTED